MIKYVIKLVSLSSGSGKTYVGTKLVEYLKRRGYKVGVVKHSVHPLILEGKDTSRYLDVGADVVIASSKGILISYVKPWVDDLRKALEIIESPIVIVEGFRTSDIGDTAAIIRNVDELEELINSKNIRLDIIISDDDDAIKEAVSKGLNAFRFNDLKPFYTWVEEKALKSVVDLLPQSNCGLCGYSDCKSLATAYLMGVKTYCVNMIHNVRLIVNGSEVQLNPFVEKMIASVIEGLISPLKGLPIRKDKVVIEVLFKN